MRRPRERGKGDDAAAADLAAAHSAVLNPAVVPPLAGVVHVRLALLEHATMTVEWVKPLGTPNIGVCLPRYPLVHIGPFGLDALLCKQAFIAGHELRKPLKRRSRLQNELSHGGSPQIPQHNTNGRIVRQPCLERVALNNRNTYLHVHYFSAHQDSDCRGNSCEP